MQQYFVNSSNKKICTHSVCVASKLHLPELLPRPIVIQLCGSHKGEMDTKTAMNSAAIDANEDSVGDAGPCRVLALAVKANLRK